MQWSCSVAVNDNEVIMKFPYLRRGKTKYNSTLIHRQIMEKYLGRSLTDTEVVHHVDGNRENNELSNLKVMSVAEHSRLHMYKPSSHIQVPCGFCGKLFDVSLSQYKHRSNDGTSSIYCSRSCSGKTRTMPRVKHRNKHLTIDDPRYKRYMDEIIINELKNGLSYNKIARKYGWCVSTIIRHAKAIGVDKSN